RLRPLGLPLSPDFQTIVTQQSTAAIEVAANLRPGRRRRLVHPLSRHDLGNHWGRLALIGCLIERAMTDTKQHPERRQRAAPVPVPVPKQYGEMAPWTEALWMLVGGAGRSWALVSLSPVHPL